MADEAYPPPKPAPPPPIAAPLSSGPPQKSKGCLYYGVRITGVLVLVVILTSFLTLLWARHSMRADAFEPTVLTQQEQQDLEEKIQILSRRDGDAESERPPTAEESPDIEIALEPVEEPPDEDFIRKPVVITEREINSIFGTNENFAETMYVRLTKDTIQFKVNYPVEEDVPILGGRTIRLNVLAGLQYTDGVLDVRIRNIAVGGVPIPNAWIGGVKNVNLVEQYAADDEMVRALAAGIETLEIQDGQILFVPAE